MSSYVKAVCPKCKVPSLHPFDFNHLADSLIDNQGAPVTCTNSLCKEKFTVWAAGDGRTKTKLGWEKPPDPVTPSPEWVAPEPPRLPPPPAGPKASSAPPPLSANVGPPPIPVPPPPPSKRQHSPAGTIPITTLPDAPDNDPPPFSKGVPDDLPMAPRGGSRGGGGWWSKLTPKDKKNYKLLFGLLGGLFTAFVLLMMFTGEPPDEPPAKKGKQKDAPPAAAKPADPSPAPDAKKPADPPPKSDP